MPRAAFGQPTEVELRILSILWQTGPCTARDVHNQLNTEKATNYSTTVKMLSVMFEKQLVTRDETASPMTFSAAIDQHETRKGTLSEVVQKLFDGSAKSLVMHLLSSQKTSAEDLNEIRQLIDQLDASKSRPKRASRKT
jgi:predicted transcriptional regulator